MSDRTKIEWSDATWNPTRGCTKVSAGCKNCYAETFAERWRGVKGHPFEQGFDLRLVPEALDLPLRWRKPRRIFVNSMSDLFHEDVPDEFIEAVFGVMSLAGRHTFQVLTKRAARARRFLSETTLGRCQAAACVAGVEIQTEVARRARADGAAINGPWPLPNVWLGVSVENQAAADERVPELLATPAAVRFLSCEPLLGSVDLRRVGSFRGEPLSALEESVGHVERPSIDWVIAGGESGPSARPMHPAWARSLRDQCQAAGVPFFFKQWGEWRPTYACADDPDARALPRVEEPRSRWLNLAGGHGFHGEDVIAVERWGKKAAGRVLDGRTWDEMPRRTP